MSDETGLICWPDWMPIPLQDGYKQTMANKHKSVDVESGLGKLYYSPDTTNKATLTVLLTQDEKMYWEMWLEQVLLNGLKWFCCPMIGITGAVEQRPARIVPQSQIETTLVGGGLDYQIKLQLEMGKTEKPPISMLYYYPLYGGKEYFECNTDNLNQLINFDLPTLLNVPEV